MIVYLCRHAEAAPGDPDELRELTARGVSQAQVLGGLLAAAEPCPTAVISSPLLRARQTATSLAEALGVEVEIDDRLAPGATAADVEAIVAERTMPFATVGHQPDCSEIVLALGGTARGFPVGSVRSVEIGPSR